MLWFPSAAWGCQKEAAVGFRKDWLSSAPNEAKLNQSDREPDHEEKDRRFGQDVSHFFHEHVTGALFESISFEVIFSAPC